MNIKYYSLAILKEYVVNLVYITLSVLINHYLKVNTFIRNSFLTFQRRLQIIILAKKKNEKCTFSFFYRIFLHSKYVNLNLNLLTLVGVRNYSLKVETKENDRWDNIAYPIFQKCSLLRNSIFFVIKN